MAGIYPHIVADETTLANLAAHSAQDEWSQFTRLKRFQDGPVKHSLQKLQSDVPEEFTEYFPKTDIAILLFRVVESQSPEKSECQA